VIVTYYLSMGFMVMVASMFIHLAATVAIVSVSRGFRFMVKKSPYAFIAIVLIFTNFILFLAHLAGITLWAWLYVYLDMVTGYADAFYSAFMINTTLGLGTVGVESRARLLGPLTASSGILMMGWSTALFVYVIQSYLPHLARRQ
jgi:hypothetical protein